MYGESRGPRGCTKLEKTPNAAQHANLAVFANTCSIRQLKQEKKGVIYLSVLHLHFARPHKPYNRTMQRHLITAHHNALYTPMGRQCQGFGTLLTTYASTAVHKMIFIPVVKEGLLPTGGDVPQLRFECPLREVDPQGPL